MANRMIRRERFVPQGFTAASFAFEVIKFEHLRDGSMRVIISVPYEHKDEALCLTEASGLLLRANVERVVRGA